MTTLELGKRYRLNDEVLPSLPTREGVIVELLDTYDWGIIDLGADGKYWVAEDEVTPREEES